MAVWKETENWAFEYFDINEKLPKGLKTKYGKFQNNLSLKFHDFLLFHVHPSF